MKRIKLMTTVFAFLSCAVLYSQDELLNSDIENNSLFENIDQEAFADFIQKATRNPISLNGNNLEEILFLTPIQMQNVKSYVSENGAILSWNEVLKIEGFNSEVIKTIKPYVTLSAPIGIEIKTLEKPLERAQVLVIERFDINSTDLNYKGGKHYQKLKVQSKQVEFNALSEKDAFESNSLDYTTYSARINFEAKQNVSVVLGDYHISAGEGLLFGGTGGSFFSSNLYSFKRSSLPFRTNTSVSENNYMRGVLLNVKGRRWSFTPFYSSRKNDLSTTGTPLMNRTGLHITEGENERKDQEKRVSSGFVVNRFLTRGKASLAILQSNLPNDSSTYEVALSLEKSIKQMFLYGEVKNGFENEISYVAGMYLPLHKTLMFGVNYRGLASKKSPYALPYQKSSAKAEEGLRLGFEYVPNANLVLSVSSEQYRLQEIGKPSFSTEHSRYSLQAVWKVGKKSSYLLAYQQNGNIEQEAESFLYNEENPFKLRLQTEQNKNKKLSFRTRGELAFSRQEENSKTGFMFYQGAKFKANKFSIKGRVVYFNVAEYEQRIYVFEHGVQYRFSVPAVYGEGVRFYIVPSTKLFKHLKVEAKIAATLKEKEWNPDFSIQVIYRR